MDELILPSVFLLFFRLTKVHAYACISRVHISLPLRHVGEESLGLFFQRNANRKMDFDSLT